MARGVAISARLAISSSPNVEANKPTAPKIKPWLPDSPAPTLIFINAAVVDVENGQILPKQTVVSEGGIIKSIQPTNDGDFPAVGKAVDLKGAFLLPGLIDCHVHVSSTPGSSTLSTIYSASTTTLTLRSTWTVKQMLLRGFTTARDTGGATASLRDAIAEHLIPGPRLFICGQALSQTGGHADSREPWDDHTPPAGCCGGHSLGHAIDGVPACLAAARENLRQGANFIKITTGGGVSSSSDPIEMIQFTSEEIQAIVTTASAKGTYVTAHTYTPKGILHAVNNGVRCIEHANLIDEPTAKILAQKDITVVPTLITYSALSSAEGFLDENGREKNNQVLSKGLESLKIMHDAGINICFGTDLLSFMHDQQSQEFLIRSKVLKPIDVLRSATINAAKLLGMEGKLGVVKVGAVADLLVTEKNPLDDVEFLAKPSEGIKVIVKEGRVVRSSMVGLDVDEVYGRL